MTQAIKIGTAQISAKNVSKPTADKLLGGAPMGGKGLDTSAVITDKSGNRVANPNANLSSDQLSAIASRHGQAAIAGYKGATPDTTTDPTLTPQVQPVNPDQTGQLSYQDALKNLSAGGLSGDALSGAQNALAGKYGQPVSSKYQQAHEALQAGGTTPPASGGGAMSAVASATPYEADTSAVDDYVSTDPGVDNLLKGITDLLNPQNQVSSVMDDYKKLYKQSGLDDINKEIIDADTVINGTEDDIRNEIQTAGGFGTDSQVQAMSLARNKNLVKRYNQLVQMKTDATNQLNTLMSLDSQDKQMAQQRLNTQISTMFNLATFRQQAVNNTREAFNSIVAKVGYAGAYAAYAHDPKQLTMIERTMGLQPGGLATLAQQPDYDMLLKQASLAEAYSTIAKNNAEMQATATANQQAQNEVVGTADTVISSANSALSQLNSGINIGGIDIPFTQGLGKTGVSGNISTLIGKGPGKDLSSTLDTIKANIAFDELQKMRKASPTGGAVGNVSDTDMKLLAAKKGSLDIGQDPKQLAANIATVQQDYINLVTKMGYQYDAQTRTIITP